MGNFQKCKGKSEKQKPNELVENQKIENLKNFKVSLEKKNYHCGSFLSEFNLTDELNTKTNQSITGFQSATFISEIDFIIMGQHINSHSNQNEIQIYGILLKIFFNFFFFGQNRIKMLKLCEKSRRSVSRMHFQAVLS